MTALIYGAFGVRKLGGSDFVEPGHVIPTHTHRRDHLTLLGPGTWRIRQSLRIVGKDGKPALDADGNEQFYEHFNREIKDPRPLHIPREAVHEFTFVGRLTEPWMEPFLAELRPERAAEFRKLYAAQNSWGNCIFAHYDEQGEPSQEYRGVDSDHA